MPYAAALFLSAGMVLLLLGFFIYIGGNSIELSTAIILLGLACDLLGFVLGYLGYRAAVEKRTVGAFISPPLEVACF